MAGVEALLALQEVPDPLRRRRRSLRRGRDILDQLDGLRLALLDGRIQPQRLERLLAILRSAREPEGDPEADALLAEIELRAEVELAKLGSVPA